MPLNFTKKSVFLATAISSVLALSACSGPVEDTLPGQPIKQRQEAFKEILRTFEPMGTALRTERYEAESFERMATALVARRDAPWAHFRDDSYQPPTRAQQVVWTRAEDFESARQAFITATDTLVESARTHELEAVRPAYQAVEESCRQCHQQFRK